MALQKIPHFREVVRLAGMDHKQRKISERVHDRHHLAGQVSPGTADPVAVGPPFASAAV